MRYLTRPLNIFKCFKNYFSILLSTDWKNSFFPRVHKVKKERRYHICYLSTVEKNQNFQSGKLDWLTFLALFSIFLLSLFFIPSILRGKSFFLHGGAKPPLKCFMSATFMYFLRFVICKPNLLDGLRFMTENVLASF